MTTSFDQRVLDWWFCHGRHDLPWQQEVTAYRVWVSEIMLQQTQVNTVIGYFDRFVSRFPTLETLAEASVDEVLGLWTGLGYYARARNLHRAAREALAQHGGLPRDLDALTGLPGIGRSTAGAILSLGFGIPSSILDGNVKRVLSRHAGIEGWSGATDVLRKLWSLAEERTPHRQAGPYAQAMMDLGATVCTRSRPQCDRCPVAEDCEALMTGRQADLPSPKPRKALPERNTWMLLLRDSKGSVLLERRPAVGIWGGLWSLPEVTYWDDVEDRVRGLTGSLPAFWQELPPMLHTFSHFRLHIRPLIGHFDILAPSGVKDAAKVWYKPGQLPPGGLPSPVVALVEQSKQIVVANHGDKSL